MTYVRLSAGQIGQVEVGTTDFDDRYNRAKAKFFQKYAAAAPAAAAAAPAPAPAAAPVEVSAEAKAEANALKAEGNKALADNPPEAVRCYSAAIELDPTNHVFFSNRAAAHTKLQQYGDAIADCAPPSRPPECNLPRRHCPLSRDGGGGGGGGGSAGEVAIELEPSYAKAYSRLGLAYYRTVSEAPRCH
eukprot:SAG11_NODE_4180_length_2025_cov_44.048806_2_plen_189_part_00